MALSPTDIGDLHTTLTRLRHARATGNEDEADLMERRLNWLLDSRIPRPTPAADSSPPHPIPTC